MKWQQNYRTDLSLGPSCRDEVALAIEAQICLRHRARRHRCQLLSRPSLASEVQDKSLRDKQR